MASESGERSDNTPTVVFPAVGQRGGAGYDGGAGDGLGDGRNGNRGRNWTIRVIAVLVALAVIAAILFVVDQRRAFDACMAAESEWTEASAAAVAAGAKRENPPAVCPSNAFGSDLRQYASQLESGAQRLRTRAAELKAEREAAQEAQRKAQEEAQSQQSGTDGSAATDLQSARSALEATLSEAQESLGELDRLGGAAAAIKPVLQAAYEKAKQLFDDSGVKDSRYYKAAAVTLQEAVDAANQWIDSQAAKSK